MFSLTVLFSLLVSEAAIRIFWSPDHPRQPVRYTFDPQVGLVHLPGQYRLPMRRCTGEPPQCEDVMAKFTVNGQGFRSVEDFRAPSGHPLIAVLGDSQVEGAQVDDEKTVSSRLEARLRNDLPEAHVRNFGITSAGFVHYHARWRKFIAAMRPDVLVVVTVGINDFRNSSERLEYFLAMQPHYAVSSAGEREVHFEPAPNPNSRVHRFVASLYEPFEIVRFVRWLKALRKESQRVAQAEGISGESLNPDIGIFELPPSNDYVEATDLGRQYLQRLISEAASAGTKVVVVYLSTRDEVDDSRWNRMNADYQRGGGKAVLDRHRPENIVRETAAAGGARFISFSDVARALPADQLNLIWHTQLDIHLTEQGQEVLAAALAPVVSELCRR